VEPEKGMELRTLDIRSILFVEDPRSVRDFHSFASRGV